MSTMTYPPSPSPGLHKEGRVDLRGVDLRGVDLRGVDLRGVDLDRAALDGADLSGADLGEASLYGASLYGANLNGAILRGTDLREACGIRSAGPVGRSGRMIYGVAHEGGEAMIQAGCWWGSPEDTIARIRLKYEGDEAEDYIAAVRWVAKARARSRV